MRKGMTAVVVVGTLALAPAVGLASTTPKAHTQTAAKPASTAKVAHLAAAGVVKSIDTSTLVITRSGKKPAEMTFTLNSSTQREGAIEVGSAVSVRYLEEGKALVATAVTAQKPKKQEAHKVPSGR